MKNLSNLGSDGDFVREYFAILSKDFPDFLQRYIKTPEMQRLKANSISCGCNYTDLFDLKFKYSNLNHSIAVALIVWNFTKDKKATIAGLFHDIANPSFKHCVDFMNGDHEKQESIDEKLEDIIKNSPEIKKMLDLDEISVSEVAEYKDYPIADNDTPKLSADRLEYTLANGYFWLPLWSISDIREIYENLTILKNEEGVDELGFSDLVVAEKFVEGASKLWPSWIDSKDKLAMQFIADILVKMKEVGEISVEDLWKLSEQEIIEKIKTCKNRKLAESFGKFQLAEKVWESEGPESGVNCKSLKTKRRYIVPLVRMGSGAKRIGEVSEIARRQIDTYLKMDFPKYAYFDFELES